MFEIKYFQYRKVREARIQGFKNSMEMKKGRIIRVVKNYSNKLL